MSTGAPSNGDGHEAFQHEALFYRDDAEYMAGTAPFITEGLSRGAAVVVATAPEQIDLLRQELAADAGLVRWVNMDGIGGNPARIIPLWRQVVANRREGGAIRGIGEPARPGRTPAERVEAEGHECLLNLAFAGVENFRLLCPYDVAALDEATLAAACHSHPLLQDRDAHLVSSKYRGVEQVTALFAEPLPAIPANATRFAVAEAGLDDVREALDCSALVHLSPGRADDFALAVHAAADSLSRTGARGPKTGLVWRDGGSVVCELSGEGAIEDPLAGREWPPTDEHHGRGLWLANQLCNLVQLRALPTGTVVRLHMAA